MGGTDWPQFSMYSLVRSRHATSQGLWLFACNALYAGAFLAFALTDAVYLRSRGLVRAYGVNELWVEPRLQLLQRWMAVEGQCVFWLEQLALLPAAWHLVLAWAFHAFLVRGRSAGV